MNSETAPQQRDNLLSKNTSQKMNWFAFKIWKFYIGFGNSCNYLFMVRISI